MKRFLLLITMALVASSLIIGCVGTVKTYDDSGQPIDIGLNREFVIALGSNPTTGYGWQVTLDESMLELVEQTYKPGEEVKDSVVGAGGVEYFSFKTLKKGETEITLVYKRPWEEPNPEDETKVFTVRIK